MTIQQKARKYINQFEVIKIQNTDETRVILKDTASKKLHDSVMKAHEGRFPNDFVFSTYLEILEKITGFDSQDLDDIRHEVVDSSVDIYTHDLTAWLASDINNVNYITDALESGTEMREGFQLLAVAQYTAIDEVYTYVQELLQS